MESKTGLLTFSIFPNQDWTADWFQFAMSARSLLRFILLIYVLIIFYIWQYACEVFLHWHNQKASKGATGNQVVLIVQVNIILWPSTDNTKVEWRHLPVLE